jgi:hypothetical protein
VLCFLTLGLVLESLHAAKVQWYLSAAFESRRLMWTLAHAHGVMIGVLHLAFAATVCRHAGSALRIASACLTSAGILLPAGFLLGGVDTFEGAPSRGVLLVPVGAVFLMLAVALAARLSGTDSPDSRRGRPLPH